MIWHRSKVKWLECDLTDGDLFTLVSAMDPVYVHLPVYEIIGADTRANVLSLYTESTTLRCACVNFFTGVGEKLLSRGKVPYFKDAGLQVWPIKKKIWIHVYLNSPTVQPSSYILWGMIWASALPHFYDFIIGLPSSKDYFLNIRNHRYGRKLCEIVQEAKVLAKEKIILIYIALCRITQAIWSKWAMFSSRIMAFCSQCSYRQSSCKRPNSQLYFISCVLKVFKHPDPMNMC